MVLSQGKFLNLTELQDISYHSRVGVSGCRADTKTHECELKRCISKSSLSCNIYLSFSSETGLSQGTHSHPIPNTKHVAGVCIWPDPPLLSSLSLSSRHLTSPHLTSSHLLGRATPSSPTTFQVGSASVSEIHTTSSYSCLVQEEEGEVRCHSTHPSTMARMSSMISCACRIFSKRRGSSETCRPSIVQISIRSWNMYLRSLVHLLISAAVCCVGCGCCCCCCCRGGGELGRCCCRGVCCCGGCCCDAGGCCCCCCCGFWLEGVPVRKKAGLKRRWAKERLEVWFGLWAWV